MRADANGEVRGVVQDLLSRIRTARRAEAPADPTLLDDLARLDGPGPLADAGRLLARVPVQQVAPPGRGFKPLRIAVAGTFTADGVVPLLRVELLRAGVAPEIQTFGFDQLVVQLSDPGSALARFEPDVTLCQLDDVFFLPPAWDPTALSELGEIVAERASIVEHAVAGFVDRSPGVVLLHTVPLSSVEHRKVIGYHAKARLGRLWRDLNGRLLALPERQRQVHTLDLEALLVDHPARLRDERLFQFAGMSWSPTAELHYAREAAKFCRALAGLAKKVLVLDLDNTLWGGVLGDDGPTGIQIGGQYPGNCYADVQRGAAALRRQGVLLAVCSKNDPALVEEVFARHPELSLRSEDFVAQAVNWGRKDHNLRQLVESLNLGLDSVVFADDSRFECDLVRREIPEVEVVHLEGDPAGHLSALLEAGYFDVLATTETDGQRTELYRARTDRHRFAESFESAADYLTQLDLRVTVAPVDDYSLPRLVQLGLRTNQFNLAGRAHSEARTRELAAAPDYRLLGFEVADRFGGEGMVGGVWIARHPDRWVIENFVMSCRVFARGVEHAVLAHLVDEAAADGAEQIEAHYRPSERNRPVETFLDGAGFARGVQEDGLIPFHLPLCPPPAVLPDWIVLEGKDAPTHA